MNAEALIREYTLEFMEKVFYFCLKKTGGQDEAEELCSDISLSIIAALKKGVEVGNFPAWVWKIAKNRYRLWAIGKKKYFDRFGPDTDPEEIEDSKLSTPDIIIRHEEIRLLRRELAFIRDDYRDIVVEYYIADRSVKDIARSMNLSEGTVKSKLHRARKILKEGIDMAREFGPKSYNPENIALAANGSQPSGLPWRAVQTMFAKNVLIEAENNPSTVEELAVALGIAAPYMQEQVDALVKATLLKKLDSKKYITNFPIVSKEAYAETIRILKDSAPGAAALADEIAEGVVKMLKEYGFAKSPRLTDNSLKWWAVFQTVRATEWHSEMNFKPEKRANGEEWEFYGFEIGNDSPNSNFVSFNNNSNDSGIISAFIMHKYNLGEAADPHNFNLDNVLFTMRQIYNGKNYNDLTEHEKAVFNSLSLIAHAEPDGTLVSDILLLDKKEYNAVWKFIENHPKFEALCEIGRKNSEDIFKILKSESNAYVKNYLPGVVNIMNHVRGFIADEEIGMGRIKLPEGDLKNFTATVYVNLW